MFRSGFGVFRNTIPARIAGMVSCSEIALRVFENFFSPRERTQYMEKIQTSRSSSFSLPWSG